MLHIPSRLFSVRRKCDALDEKNAVPVQNFCDDGYVENGRCEAHRVANGSFYDSA